MRIKEGTPLEIFTDKEGEIILKKYSPIGELNLLPKNMPKALAQATGMVVCITDHDQVVAAAGQRSREFAGKEISRELDGNLRQRNALFSFWGTEKYLWSRTRKKMREQ